MKWGWKLSVVAVLLISLGSLYFVEDKFMGKEQSYIQVP